MPPNSAAMQKSLSRGSTASVQSLNSHPSLDTTTYGDASEFAGTAQWLDNSAAHVKADSVAMHTHQMANHISLMQQNAVPMQDGHDYAMNDVALSHPLTYQLGAMQSRHPLPIEPFPGADTQLLDRDDNDDGRRNSVARSSANNEHEMRQLFFANKHRSLPDIATELHGNERGPNSERTRQVFAMIWINQVCSRGKGSVPRGRVYASYASRCATERITVLNPASFGKLVRVLFPGLKTRRLGVRGESKYHYVNFNLAEDEVDEAPNPSPALLPQPSAITIDFNTLPSQTARPASQTAAQPASHPAASVALSTGVSMLGRAGLHSVYQCPKMPSLDQLSSTTEKAALCLNLSPDSAKDDFHPNDHIQLPSLEPYLPPGADQDAARSLDALYRAHCTSLISCMRYVKEKTFWHQFMSFHGTLTMPVQKLFAHPQLAPWIETCDFLLYQRMIRITSTLILQVMPPPVMETLRRISERLVPHIREAFQGHPSHVIQAKVVPASIFASLVDRLLRVNLSAHAAANVLQNSANRDLMYTDWIEMVRLRKLAECVPSRGMDDLVELLVSELRFLLDPVNVPWEKEQGTVYGEMALRKGYRPETNRSERPSEEMKDVLSRWQMFLQSLPSRFPYASHADIVWCVERVGNHVVRDLTMYGAQSFSAWWVTKAWLDEMVSWLAEFGGFLSMQSSQTASVSPDASRATIDEPRHQEEATQPSSFPAGADKGNQDAMDLGDGSHDDSGISIRTPDEDFSIEKFSFPPDADQSLVTGE